VKVIHRRKGKKSVEHGDIVAVFYDRDDHLVAKDSMGVPAVFKSGIVEIIDDERRRKLPAKMKRDLA
jgi:hypothetical protein